MKKKKHSENAELRIYISGMNLFFLMGSEVHK